ncbi:MAG: GerMN domain-containing protein [Clostridia bacterium]|nr:GerMN domain-containing protein [Clostridia bacterium]
MKRGSLKGRSILLLVMALSMLLILSGCGLVDKLVSMKQGLKEEPQISLEEPIQEFPQWVVEEPKPTGTGEYKLTLFFSDPLGQYLVKEERVIPKVEGIGRSAVNELIKGPNLASNLMPTVPDNTILLDINVKQEEKLAIVDFSRALVENHMGGSSAEALTVYSIVNTLTQFPTVERVQILVNGQYVETIAGHLDVSKPLTRNDLLNK